MRFIQIYLRGWRGTTWHTDYFFLGLKLSAGLNRAVSADRFQVWSTRDEDSIASIDIKANVCSVRCNPWDEHQVWTFKTTVVP